MAAMAVMAAASTWLPIPSLNTLADFRVARKFKGESGQGGSGRNKTGRSGEDLDVKVPQGTAVHDVDTGELICDLTEAGQRQMVAEGGRGGLGNTRFKSSVNRAPRKTTNGTPGEARHLKLELKVLADVGLLGMPNAGKSTLDHRDVAGQAAHCGLPVHDLCTRILALSVSGNCRASSWPISQA